MYGTQANLLLLPCPTVNRHPVLRRAGQPRAQKPCPEGLATPPAELPGPAEVLAEVRTGWGPSSTRIMKVEVCLIHFSFLSSSNQQLGLEGVSRAWTQLSWILRPRLPTSPPFPNPLFHRGRLAHACSPQQLLCAPFIPRCLPLTPV